MQARTTPQSAATSHLCTVQDVQALFPTRENALLGVWGSRARACARIGGALLMPAHVHKWLVAAGFSPICACTKPAQVLHTLHRMDDLIATIAPTRQRMTLAKAINRALHDVAIIRQRVFIEVHRHLLTRRRGHIHVPPS